MGSHYATCSAFSINSFRKKYKGVFRIKAENLKR